MLSVALVRSAGGAANYFAADNYYTRADADRSGEWLGEGAARLGLEGGVDPKIFEALLRGELPTGERVGGGTRAHRAGVDLTFSMPKTWSLIALVGGDRRILEAYREAVKETLGWAERNAAHARIEVGGREKIVPTGNLVVALFQHDTNRNQEPNAHFHAVVANVTQTVDGKWRALRNDKLWSYNTLLNAMTMAHFRGSVEKLGYETGPVLKHGNFEAAGIPRDIVMAFSSRRREILDQAAQMRHRGPKVMDAATLMTRAAKPGIEDRTALVEGWRQVGRDVGMDFTDLIARANARAAKDIGMTGLIADSVRQLSVRGREWIATFTKAIGGRENDPLLPPYLARKEKDEIAAAHAVASAVRHLSEREAAFTLTDIYKAALDFGLPTTMAKVEARTQRLIENGNLLRGDGDNHGIVTTMDALAIEERIIAQADAGRGTVQPVLAPEVAVKRLQEHAQASYGLRLNVGQEAAGRLLLSSANRIVAIQGVAGAGKSTLLRPVAEILRTEGHRVIGLAVQNTLVQMLEKDTGIASTTVAKFLRAHRDLLRSSPDPARLEAARNDFRGSIILLDEASMVGNADKEKLVRLANLLEVQRFAAIGDAKQLGAVDAGKPFAVMQAAGVETATMGINIRARDEMLRDAQYAAQAGKIDRAMALLAPHTVETADRPAITAAETWLSLTPLERERTAIYASGRRLRGEVNEAVQAGLKANGELGEPALRLDTLVRISATREELRYASTYEKGQVAEFDREQRAQSLPAGQHRVEKVDRKNGIVTLRDAYGRKHRFDPGRLKPREARDPLQLFERRSLDIHAGDRIRWTDSDHRRGLYNSDQAQVLDIDRKGVMIRTSAGTEQHLKPGDKMLERLDLAYALNAHMAQGLTSDRGIAVMDSSERKLASQQTFLVTITRLRDGLTLVVDNASRLGAAIERNPGDKTSALETLKRLGEAAARGLAKGREAATGKAKEPMQLERSKSKSFDFGL